MNKPTPSSMEPAEIPQGVAGLYAALQHGKDLLGTELDEYAINRAIEGVASLPDNPENQVGPPKTTDGYEVVTLAGPDYPREQTGVRIRRKPQEVPTFKDGIMGITVYSKKLDKKGGIRSYKEFEITAADPRSARGLGAVRALRILDDTISRSSVPD